MYCKDLLKWLSFRPCRTKSFLFTFFLFWPYSSALLEAGPSPQLACSSDGPGLKFSTISLPFFSGLLPYLAAISIVYLLGCLCISGVLSTCPVHLTIGVSQPLCLTSRKVHPVLCLSLISTFLSDLSVQVYLSLLSY